MSPNRREIISLKLTSEQEESIRYESDLILDMDLCWEPHAGQKLIKSSLFGSGHKTIFLECGRKFGKTEMLAYLLYRYALSNPNSACYFIAPYQKQARELIWANNRLQDFFLPLVDPKTNLTHKGHTRVEAYQIMEELKEKYGVKINEQEMRIKFANGSFIKLDGADNHQAYRGINPHLIAYDEWKDHHPKFHIGMEPNLATFEAPLIIVGTPCEGDEDNMVNFNATADYAKLADDQSHFQLPTMVNPHISKAWLAKKKKELFAKGEEDKWFREYCAMRVMAGQRNIFPMLSKGKHVISEKEMKTLFSKKRKDYDLFFGFDPASSSCFAGLFVAINRNTKQILVLDEIYETSKGKMTSGQIWKVAQEIVLSWNVLEDEVRYIYDAAATWFQNEINDKFRVGLEPSIKDIGRKKEMRLSLIKDMLLLDGCVVYNEAKCSFDMVDGYGLFWEMSNYRVNDKNIIPKENDHSIDTLRYILSNAYYNEVPRTPISKDPYDMRRAFTPEQDAKGSRGLEALESQYDEFYC